MKHEFRQLTPPPLGMLGRAAQVSPPYYTGGTLVIMGLSDETDFQKIVDEIEIDNRSNFDFSWQWANSQLTVTIRPKARPANP